MTPATDELKAEIDAVVEKFRDVKYNGTPISVVCRVGKITITQDGEDGAEFNHLMEHHRGKIAVLMDLDSVYDCVTYAFTRYLPPYVAVRERRERLAGDDF